MIDMSSDRWRRLRRLLDRALELDGEARKLYVLTLRPEDAELRDDLERLLAEHAELGEDKLTDAMGRAIPAVMEELRDDEELDAARVGDTIGPYRLMRLLGTGGMGAVYLAEHPGDGFTHRVALKIVRKALGRNAAERFEREREILAGLKHPGIALLFDGGRTRDGHSFYTMEYVDGEPISAYCTAHAGTVAERVRLLLQVAAALAYAHQNLIVHRDIKPSNVLVTRDARVKLVDFGLAKALDEQMFPQMTQTNLGPMTPAYAAPEQFLGGATTVATDIYQFGVLCYFVLAGRLPYHADPHDNLQWARSVTEDEPITLAHAIDLVDRDGVAPPAAGFRRQLTRDLDAILRKSLAKARGERYRSMDAMIADLEAFLDGRPVVARRAGPLYFTWRFVLRQRYAVAATLLAFLALGAITLVAWHQSGIATAEADHATREVDRANSVASFLVDLFKVADPGVNRGERLNANEILERGSTRIDNQLQNQPAQRAQLLSVIGEVYLALGDYARATAALEKSANVFRALPNPDRYPFSKNLRLLAEAKNSLGDIENAKHLLEEEKGLLVDGSNETLEELSRMQLARAEVQVNLGDVERELEEVRQAMTYAERAGTNDPGLLLAINGELGAAQRDLGRYAEARDTFRRAYDDSMKAYAKDDFRVVNAAVNLGDVLIRLDDLSGAATILEPVPDAYRHQFGAGSRQYATIMEKLAVLARRQGHNKLALERYAESEHAYRSAYGDSHPAGAWVIVARSELLIEQGDYAAGLAGMEQALSNRKKLLADDHPEVAHSYYGMAEALIPLGRYKEAHEYASKALSILQGKLPPDHPFMVLCLAELGLADYAIGDKAGAKILWDDTLERMPRAYPVQGPEVRRIRATIADPEAALHPAQGVRDAVAVKKS
jgi:serine/threonine-protein kinase